MKTQQADRAASFSLAGTAAYGFGCDKAEFFYDFYRINDDGSEQDGTQEGGRYPP